MHRALPIVVLCSASVVACQRLPADVVQDDTDALRDTRTASGTVDVEDSADGRVDTDGSDSDTVVDSDPPLWPFRREVPAVRLESCSACAIDAQGMLFCWGNRSAQCERNPGFIGEISPGPFRMIAQTFASGIAVREDGTVFWWPGPGVYDTRWQPFIDHETAWVDLDAMPAGSQVCGVDADGYLFCVLQSRLVPDTAGWRVVSAGYRAACAVHSTDGLSCWGEEAKFGDLPDRGADAVDVAMGPNNACIVTTAGTVRCGGEGALVASLPASFPRPVTRVVVDSAAGCVLMDDGSIACWSLDQPDARAVVDGVPTDGPYVDLDVVSTRACAITSESRLDCWGVDRGGILNPPERP
ncbi:MAG: hypothetical protein H6733_10500 [Alphaproteobacteria bacterium]|nr:hypothetical protein [Alphaproteobacteria bacterium]